MPGNPAVINNPATQFIEAACSLLPDIDRERSTETIRNRYPEVTTSSIHAAAILADEATVCGFLARDPSSVHAKSGPLDCDALTYLCFSRYLRLDLRRSDAFVRTAARRSSMPARGREYRLEGRNDRSPQSSSACSKRRFTAQPAIGQHARAHSFANRSAARTQAMRRGSIMSSKRAKRPPYSPDPAGKRQV